MAAPATLKRYTMLIVTFGACHIASKASAESPSQRSTPKLVARSEHKAPNLASRARPLEDARDAGFRDLLRIADANADGQVTELELERLVGQEIDKQIRLRFQRLDRNGDGRVSRAETPTMNAERFVRFDLNADGSFTLVELSSVLRSQATRRCRVAFARLDFDRDGVLSAADPASAEPTRISAR